jgi:Domain of unknown function (DUF4249)
MDRNMMFHKYIYNTESNIHGKNLLLCFGLLIVAFLLSSCEQDLNIEINTNDKRLLVDGEFTNETVVHSIRLYCSGSLITGKRQTIVSGAKIYITDNIDTFYYIENKDTLGLYQTAGKVGGKGGHNYTLTMTNIDIDKDGKMETYTAQAMMPVPIKFDSLVSFPGENGDKIIGTIENKAYFKTMYNGPDYCFNYLILNSDTLWTLTDELGSGAFNAMSGRTMNTMYKVPKVNNPGLTLSWWSSLFIEPQMSKVSTGDIISFICWNFTTAQYEFLKEFDNNTNSGDLFQNNMYDQLKIPTNLPTNIEPADKAAGYFFVYSVSKISKVLNE